MRRVLTCLLFAVGCATSAGRGAADPSSLNPSQPHPPGEVGNVNAGNGPESAALMTAIAAGASVAQRAEGGCYANCPPGTVCNKATGFCDTLPCRGLCAAGTYCDTSGPFDKCVASGLSDLKIGQKKDP